MIGSDIHAGGWFSTAGGQQSLRFGIWHEPVTPALSIGLDRQLSILTISWPSPSLGWTLQQNSNAVISVNWSNVTSEIQDDGTNKSLLVNPPAGNRFYRLHRP